MAVITLFDKGNEVSNQSIFNQNDVNVIKAIGAFLVQILQVRTQFTMMDNRIQSMKLAYKESEQIIEVTNNIMRRKKLIEKLTKTLN